MPHVVVTGVGLLTPLGNCAEEILSRISHGENAFAPPAGFEVRPFPCRTCAQITDFDPEPYVPEPKTLRLMSRDAVFAVAAARRAMRDAGLCLPRDYRPENVALYGATGLAGIPLAEVAPLVRLAAGEDGGLDLARFGRAGLRRVRPVLSFKILSNMPICFVSIFEQIRGPNAVYNPWEGQGAQAILAGVDAILRGDVPCALVGGCDVKTHELGFIALQQQGALASWGVHGEGSVPGEGAAFLVLERADAALARGARVYARIAACGLRSVTRDDERTETYESLFAEVVASSPDVLVAAGDGDVPLRTAEEAALRGLTRPADRVVRPKANLGNLFAAAAATQVGLGAEICRALAAGRRVLADCFGHGSNQAVFVLERL